MISELRGFIKDEYPSNEEDVLMPKVKIYLVGLKQLDHIFISDEYIVLRSTLLWRNEEQSIKGKYAFTKNRGQNDCTFTIYSHFIDKLRSDAKPIDNYDRVIFRRHGYENNRQSAAEEIYVNLKNKNSFCIISSATIQQSTVMAFDASCGDAYKNISTTRSHQHNVDIDKNSSIENDQVSVIPGDLTQNRLLKYLSVTERLFNDVIKKYNNSSAYARIVPSADLGMPNNVTRLSGGFCTGIVVYWKSAIPIIPLDTTVNVCSSSVYTVEGLDKLNPRQLLKKFSDIIKSLQQSNNMPYIFNFNKGNHFVVIGKNDRDKFYLIFHSSAHEYKYTYHGLYPHRKKWFDDYVKVHVDENGRYFRYLVGGPAKVFVEKAMDLSNYAEERQQCFVDIIQGACALKLEKRLLKHHYSMPAPGCIAMGTYLEEKGVEVPIFSRPTKDIILFKIDKTLENEVCINGKARYIVPHGFGQELKTDWLNSTFYPVPMCNREDGEFLQPGGINFSSDADSLKAFNTDETLEEIVNLRNYENPHEFLKVLNPQIKGQVVETIHQLGCFNRNGLSFIDENTGEFKCFGGL